jgi:hypothetical protein
MLKASKQPTQSKLRNQNPNEIRNPGRKQSWRCQTEGHQQQKAKASQNGLHCICTQEKKKTKTLSESMHSSKQSPPRSTAIALRKQTKKYSSTMEHTAVTV